MSDTGPSKDQIRTMLERALQQHAADRLTDAADIYLAVLDLDPAQADALHLTGVVAHQLGRNDLALQFICEAITHDATQPVFYNNLGNVLAQTGQVEDAGRCYEYAISLDPAYAKAWMNAAAWHQACGNSDAAKEFRSRALELDPSLAA